MFTFYLNMDEIVNIQLGSAVDRRGPRASAL